VFIFVYIAHINGPLSSDKMSVFKHINNEAGRVDGLISALMNLPPCPVWIHESHVHNALSLPRGPTFGQYHVLTCLLGIIDVGYGGNKRKRDDPKEFYSLNPEYANGITYQKYGRAEPFDAGSLALDKTPLKARWFKIEDDATQVVCDLKSQLEIILDAMGDDSVNMSGSSLSVGRRSI
jgi:hypothetical protein